MRSPAVLQTRPEAPYAGTSEERTPLLGPMIVTLGAVAMGATLALVTTRGHVALGALRTFAAIAVVAAVLIQLLPEGIRRLLGRSPWGILDWWQRNAA